MLIKPKESPLLRFLALCDIFWKEKFKNFKFFSKKIFCAFWALGIAPTLDVPVLFHISILRANTECIKSLNLAQAYSLLRAFPFHRGNNVQYFHENPEVLKLFFLLLFLCGDIKRNPGPAMADTQIQQNVRSKEYCLKYVHLNIQGIRKNIMP